jgi:hypothetical protein
LTQTELNVVKNTAAMVSRVNLIDVLGTDGMVKDPSLDRYVIEATGAPVCEIQASLVRYLDRWIGRSCREFAYLADQRALRKGTRDTVTKKMMDLLKQARTHALLGGWEMMGTSCGGYWMQERPDGLKMGKGCLTNAQKKKVQEYVQCWFWTGLNIVILNLQERREDHGKVTS